MKFGTFRKSNAAAPDRPEGKLETGVESDVAALNQRLDDLTAELDRLGRLATAQSARPVTVPHPEDWTAQRLAQAITRLDQRLDHLIVNGQAVAEKAEQRISATDRIDHAVAEIAARQRALDADTAAPAPRMPEPARAPGPAQDLTGLEQQLRHITTQMQTLQRPCGLDDAVTALRSDLAVIGRALTEAMPRQAVESLETEVRALKERIDASRQSGADVVAIAGVEHWLAEVREALRSLTPAESLAGFDEAVRGLSRKIDQIVATSQDPRALQQLEAAVSVLRSVASHVASDDALARLSDEVRGLAAKIEHIADAGMREGADALTNLERRVATLANAFEAGARNDSAIPPKLEALIKTLSDKIEQMELSRGDHLALGSLEDRIVKLVERLDANDSRLGHLGAIERGLADLLIKLDELRSGNGRAKSVRDGDAPPAIGVTELKRDIAEIRELQSEIEQRAKDSLHTVQGTLGQVFDRLAVIETDSRSEPSARAENRAAALQAAKPLTAASLPVSEAPNPTRLPPQNGDPALPPDYPLEPGSGMRPRAPGSPADRIAASEAAVGSGKHPQTDPGVSNFIIAARRAAQAAGHALPSRPSRAGVAQAAAHTGRGKLARGLTSVAVAISVAVIVLGAVRLGMNMLPIDPPSTGAQAPKEPAAPAKAADETPTPTPTPPTPATAPAAPGRRSALTPADDAITTSTPPSGLVVPSEPRRAAPPPQAVATSPDPEVTSSIGRPAAGPPAAAPSPTPALGARPAAGDKVPTAITSPTLRAALAQSDPTAEYELALRFAEGRGVPQSLEEAARWFDRAAKSGLAPAQFRLGSLYEKGHGVKKDVEAARRLYLSAAEKGNAKAMHNLAVLHAEGVDGKPDYKSAAQWFRKAAGHGVSDSQYNLGILYARGIGVEQNLPESFKWFSLAAAQGDNDAVKKRDDVAARLDQQSLTAAKLAIDTWAAEPQPEAATTVRTPAGGWDKAPTAQPGRAKPRPASPKADPS